jgi:hypothetical protein
MAVFEQPTPQRIRPEHAQTLEKYSWENKDDGENPTNHQYLSENLFLLMQSVVVRISGIVSSLLPA